MPGALLFAIPPTVAALTAGGSKIAEIMVERGGDIQPHKADFTPQARIDAMRWIDEMKRRAATVKLLNEQGL